MRKPQALAAALLAAGLVAAGCSSDTDDSAPATSAAAPATSAAAPATSAAPATTVAQTPIDTSGDDIVSVAVQAGSFKTLVAAVQAAGLAETLQTPGPFTVFAPSDDAFANVPARTTEALIAHPEILANLLTYHVVAGEISADQLQTGTLTTVSGLEVAVTRLPDGTVKVGNAVVVAGDVPASNGVIHVVDSVMLP